MHGLAQATDYTRDIKPLLKQRCYACHGALKQEAELRLDTGRSLLRGGDSGRAVVAGDPAASLLLERVASSDETYRMPPEGEPLTVQQVELISDWIRQGASLPGEEQAERDPTDQGAHQL